MSAKSYALTAASMLAAILSGCADNRDAQAKARYEHARAKVHQAMCGSKPGDKATALAALSEDPTLKDMPDDVFDIAAEIEQRGCASTKQR
ncbi:hypothetical protein Q5H91_03580 [Sphingomonas sp. KR1UV-12]|uniref:Lipoprotein n=1 Tax=Sphingomonas aurea TaxID=3063994 RepID=A0ABT9EHM6_9SPHN|nr:hypothetical protein [Sphingomonas sp. KR1UV-12]MDP1026281.1 hypothetical protein [Sphingomonas sp. KR1UV-12]